MNRRAIGFWLGVAVVLLLVGGLTGGRQQSGPPLDPRSTDPTGTRALMIFLDEIGASVANDVLPGEATDTVLLLADTLDDGQTADVDDWVAGGGTLVVADPSSSFAPPEATVESTTTLAAGDCTLGGLAALTVEAGSFLQYPNDPVGEDGDGGEPVFAATDWCFGDGATSYVHVRLRGDGRIVAIGSAVALTNQYLDEADNAVLAARTIAGTDGGLFGPAGSPVGAGPDSADPASVAVLFEPIAGAGSRGLGDLIPSAAKWATWQLLVAFGLYVLWRAPRFGRPVTEPQAVELPGSLLVRATGELHRRAGGHAQASMTLRRHLDGRLRRQLRASPELPAADVAGLAASANGADAEVVGRALAGPTAATGDELGALLVDIDTVNATILATEHGPGRRSGHDAGGTEGEHRGDTRNGEAP